jgi:hypothetical protein
MGCVSGSRCRTHVIDGIYDALALSARGAAVSHGRSGPITNLSAWHYLRKKRAYRNYVC